MRKGIFSLTVVLVGRHRYWPPLLATANWLPLSAIAIGHRYRPLLLATTIGHKRYWPPPSTIAIGHCYPSLVSATVIGHKRYWLPLSTIAIGHQRYRPSLSATAIGQFYWLPPFATADGRQHYWPPALLFTSAIGRRSVLAVVIDHRNGPPVIGPTLLATSFDDDCRPYPTGMTYTTRTNF